MAAIKEWARRAAGDVHVVWASSAGLAIGILRRERGRGFDGVLVDHDLTQANRTSVDDLLSGKDVANAMAEHLDRDIPVFVHSGNRLEAPRLAAQLMSAGFGVTYIPFEVMTYGDLETWLEEVREAADEVTLYRRWQARKRRTPLRVPREFN